MDREKGDGTQKKGGWEREGRGCGGEGWASLRRKKMEAGGADVGLEENELI